MKFKSVLACAAVAITFAFALQAKEQSGQTVDSGSFGIFVNGQRVVTETFDVRQASGGNTINSELHEEGSRDKATQSSQMQLTAAGELVRYDWHELTPGKTQLELLPNDQFLIERVTVNPGEKPAESCRRELLEETGFAARRIHRLGNNSPCTGRLDNRIHAFFVEAGERIGQPEPGIEMKLVTPRQLVRMIKGGEFVSQLHIGSLMLAELHGFIDLPRSVR